MDLIFFFFFNIRATFTSLGFLSIVPWIQGSLHLLGNRRCMLFMVLTLLPVSVVDFLDSLTPDSYDIIISVTRKVSQPWNYDLITVPGRRCYLRSKRSLLQIPILQ